MGQDRALAGLPRTGEDRMMAELAPLMLFSITGAMVALPLSPAVIELLRRQDAGPLRTRTDDGRIGNYAQAFRRYIASSQPVIARCGARSSLEEVRLCDGQYALVVGATGHCNEIDLDFPNSVLFSRAAWLRDGQRFMKDVYAADVLHSGKRTIFRAVLGEKDIFLGEGTQVLRWLHAEGNVAAEAGCTLFGRLSAGESINLSTSCRFERVQAAAICAVSAGQTLSCLQERPPAPALKPRKTTEKLGRSRVDGDVHLRLGEMFLGNIIATGSVHVEKDTQIIGSAKAHGKITLHDRAQVHGAVVGNGSVRTGSDCYVEGPLLTEGEIYLGPGTRVGTPNAPTTVSAPRIHLGSGCVVYGTLWAKVEGRVEV